MTQKKQEFETFGQAIAATPDVPHITGALRGMTVVGEPAYCAVGMGMQNAFGSSYASTGLAMNKFPGLAKSEKCPVCAGRRGAQPLLQAVIHMNDSHLWSRAQTGAWCDAKERVYLAAKGLLPAVQASVKAAFSMKKRVGAKVEAKRRKAIAAS